MKKKVADMILIMGIGMTELIMDIDTSIAVFNSIEYSKVDKKVWLHMFAGVDLDLSYDFDDLDDIDQMAVYVALASILYN